MRTKSVIGTALVLVVTLSSVALGQANQAPQPGIALCIGKSGTPVTAPADDGTCPRGSLSRVAQQYDVQELYVLIGLLQEKSDSHADALDRLSDTIDLHGANLDELELTKAAADYFLRFIDLVHPAEVTFEGIDDIIGEKGGAPTDVSVRNGLPGSAVRHVDGSFTRTIGTVVGDGSFSGVVHFPCFGDPTKIVVIALNGLAREFPYKPNCG